MDVPYRLFKSVYFFKIRSTVLTQGANDILGKLLSLIYVSADLANVTLLAFGLRLGLDV